MVLIHEMLERASKDYPLKDAFVHRNKRYTFFDINEASTKTAAFLRSKGVMRGDRIGIFSSKNIEEIIAIFAIIKLGCVFVHINPHFKEDQLSHIINDCDINALFIHSSKAGILSKAGLIYGKPNLIISMTAEIKLSGVEVCYLDEILENVQAQDKITGKINESDTAAIIYTSGSTGKPKGITVTHKIFYDSTVISARVLENNSNDRLISITPFSFDGSLSQLFTSIYVGATLVLQESNFPKDVVDTMLNEKITGFHAVPSFWKMLLQKHSPFEKHRYPHLRYVSIIGEAFPMDELMRLRRILKDTKFFMMYGITEAFRSTYLHPDDFDKKIPSVGKPFPGVEILIVDEEGNPSKNGEIGEIVHKGVFVSPGYWNDPDRTKKVFKDGVLYTGDLGKFDDEGYLYFVGRKDGMIKSMGYRISPEEIEECLCKIEGVNEAAVTSINDAQMNSRIKAIIVSENGIKISNKSIIDYCKTRLPYYMVPEEIEFTNEIPKTGTFKINRSQL